MTTTHELDVRTQAPARRHELIFESYFALTPGEEFLLVNDHDPKPLYYQLAAEHPGEFSWEPVAQGPETWSVRIGRVGSESEVPAGTRTTPSDSESEPRP